MEEEIKTGFDLFYEEHQVAILTDFSINTGRPLDKDSLMETEQDCYEDVIALGEIWYHEYLHGSD